LRQGDLSARSQVVSRTVELDELALTFNEMAAALEQREAQRRQAEDTLREQREFLRVTLASIGDAVIATDTSGAVTFMNPIAEALIGWKQADAVGQQLDAVFTLVNEDTRDAVGNLALRVVREGAVVGLADHALLVTPHHNEIHLDTSGAPIRNTADELIGVVLILRDITLRRRAERRLLPQYTVARILAEADNVEDAATKVLHAICEGSGWQVGTLWRVDRRANVLRHETTWQSPVLPSTALQAVNRDAALQSGCDLPGRVWADGRPVWLSDLSGDAHFMRITAAIETGLRAALALPIRSRSEVIGVLECLSDKPQPPDEDLLAMLEALSSQIGNFVERKEAEDALYKSNMILQAVFEDTTDSIYVKDRQGRYLLANSSTAHAVGRTVHDIVGQDDMSLYSPETAHIIMAEDQQVMASGQVQTLENIIAFHELTRVYHSVKAPYHDAHGKVIGLIGISRDVTDLKQAEKVQRLLAEAGRVLTTSLDDETRMTNIAQLIVADLADWCAIDVIEDDHSVRRVAVAHIDPAKAALIEDLVRRYPLDWNLPFGVSKVLRTGQSEFYPEVTNGLLHAPTHEAEQLAMLRELGQKSAIIVPMVAHGRTLGAMTLVWSIAGRRYTPADVTLAEDIADRCALALDNARLYKAESATRAEAEAAQQRLAFLAEVNRALMTTTELTARLSSLTRYIVPTLADWCTVNLVEPDGSIRLASAAHRDPGKTSKIYELAQHYSIDVVTNLGTSRVLRTGLPEMSSRVIGDHPAESGEHDDYERRLEELGLKSYMIVPLKARGRTMGAMTLVSTNAGRPYTRADLMLAEELAARAALAVDNALLYQEAQQLNADLEQRVKERTALLEANNEKLQHQIAERLRAEAELSEVQRRLAKGGEDERLHLAQELHDGPVQDLYGISYRLAELRHALRDDNALASFVATQAEVQQVVHTLRNILSELRPPTLIPFGLRTAIQSHAERFQIVHPALNVHLDLMPDQQQLPEAVRLALYRIYQQMLSNVARHAQAQQVNVRFALNEGEAVLEIQDDGCGFVAPDRWIDLARQGHLGLIGAAERAEALNGKFTVTSAPGEGTLVSVNIPLEPAA
jgi:PAS domain S-box-containing protein